MYTNVLNLEESVDGNRIKQGDLSVMRYILTDANNDDLQLDGKPAKVYLTDVEGVKYIYNTTVKIEDNSYLCDVVINAIIPDGTYTLEIWVDNTYCFPSDRKSKVKVEPSVLGNGVGKLQSEDMLADIIEYVKKHNSIENNEIVKSITITSTNKDDEGNTSILFSDGTEIIIPKGEKGSKGDTGPQGIAGPKGEKGEPFTYDDFTKEQLESLKVNTNGSAVVKSPLDGLTGVFIGDSITEVNFRTSKNYHQFIAERTGLSVVNLGISGTGYVDRLNAVDSIAEQPDFISVFLGTNDYSGVTGSKPLGNVTDTDASTVASHIYTLLTNLMNKFPNTPIVTITPLPRIESNPMNENQGENGYKLVELVEIIKSISKRLAIPCLDLYHNSHLRVWYDEVNQHFFSYQEGQADGLHPNVHGHEYISYPIQSFLEQHAIVGEKQPFISDEEPVIKIAPEANFEIADDGLTIAEIPSVLPTWIDNQSFMLRIPVETVNLTGKKILEADYKGNKILNPSDILDNSPFWYAVSSYPKGEYNRIDEINEFVQHLNYVGDTGYGKTYEPITIKLKYK